MARKMYAIQVSDIRGNWITLKRISALSEKDVLEELQREMATRKNKYLRAIDGDSRQVVIELSVPKKVN